MNFVCFLGAFSVFIVLIARVIEGMPLITIISMLFMFVVVVAALAASAKLSYNPKIFTAVVIFIFALVLWPLVLFTNGGPSSGMPAYFTLIIMLEFLLLDGAIRIAWRR